jgi:hypothetical protein
MSAIQTHMRVHLIGGRCPRRWGVFSGPKLCCTVATALLAVIGHEAVAQSPATQAPASRSRDFEVLRGVPQSSLDSLLLVPEPAVALPLPAKHRLTPSDGAYDLWFDRSVAQWRLAPETPQAPNDSIRAGVLARGRAWVTQLQREAPDAIHLDDAGRVYVAAGQDSIARRFITERLALPALLPAERAFTLWTAVTAFADTARPERYPVAETYMAALDELPDDPAGVYRLRAHAALALAYDRTGEAAPALRHALASFARLERMPLQDREDAYHEAAPFLLAAHELQAAPDGARRLDSLAAVLKSAATPSATMTWRDSAKFIDAQMWRDSLVQLVGSAHLLGTPAPAIQAHAWWNTPGASTNAAMSTPTTLALNDGTVRLVLFANVFCCIDALLTLQRLQGELPRGASMLYVTATTGHINGVLVPPEEEVRRLQHVYRDTLRLTLPTAMWVGQKQPTPWGGSVPAPSPNIRAYFVAREEFGGQGTRAAPYMVLVDGKGIVRHVFSSKRGFTRADEQRAMALIRALVSRP